MMRHHEGTFYGYGRFPLYYQSWKPDDSPRAVLLIVHGHGEHSGRYTNVVDRLVPQGFAVYALDHRGHGRSPGPRGYVNSMAEFRGDVGALLRQAVTDHPHVPLFLLGHSLGGLISLDFLLHHPDAGLRGAIISAPAVGQIGVAPILLTISRLLSRVWPTFSLGSGLDAKDISRDPQDVAAYQSDPLIHSTGTVRLASEVMDAAARCQANAPALQLPLLMIHGSADRITSPQDSRRFFDNAGSADKTYLAYEGGYHESHNDTHHEQVVADMLAWMEKRTADS